MLPKPAVKAGFVVLGWFADRQFVAAESLEADVNIMECWRQELLVSSMFSPSQ